MSHVTVATSGSRLQTVADASRYLSTSQRRMWELIRSGQIAAVRDGGKVKVRTAELDRYADDLPAYEPAS